MDVVSLGAAWKKAEAMLNDGIRLLPNVLLAIVVFAVFWFVAKFIRRFVRRATRHRKNARNLGLVLGRLAQGLIVALGLFLSLSIVFPSLEPGDLVQLLGVGGVAIGFAFRDILQNFLAGILILLTEPFQLDDQIVFKGFEGTVENIETRATTIRTYDGRRIVIPNAELFTNSVTVNTAFDKRRLEYDVGIGYGDDIAKAKGLILDILRSADGVIQDPPPEALVVELAGSTINIRARWWVDMPRRADVMDSRDEILTQFNNVLVSNGIDLPFPTQQILFHDQTEESDGDRRNQREGWPSGGDGKQAPRSRQQIASQNSQAKQ